LLIRNSNYLNIFFYHIFLFLFRTGAVISSLFNSKTKKWLLGRKDIFNKLETSISNDANIIWMHCSSLGEFEQGRPVLEKLRLQYPASKILLTFFSPSGYEVQKDYAGAHWVFYLPMDSRSNAKRFLEIVNPSLVIFVKYEFWYYYVKKIKEKRIPLLLVSALFPKNTAFFKWYGRLQRKMLPCFTHFFVQNEESKKLLGQLGYSNISVAGDTRFDRVIEIAEKWESVSVIEKFIADKKVIVAGSTWQEDEIILQRAMKATGNICKLIIAPHELTEKELEELRKMFPDSVRYSQLINASPDSELFFSNCLIIDNMGMLSRLYKYGQVTYVGGGMTSYGVHNVLEAAVYGKPVIFGPYYQKYIEAVGLVENKGAIIVKNERELSETFASLLENKNQLHDKTGEAAARFMRQHAGATQKIFHFIQEKRLLTN